MNPEEFRAQEDPAAKEFKAQIDRIIETVEGHLGASELAQIREFNYVGECKLAVEALLFEIAHKRVSVGPTEQDILVNLGRRMKVDAELLAPFNIK